MDVNTFWASQKNFINHYNNISVHDGGIKLAEFNELIAGVIAYSKRAMNVGVGMRILDLGCWTGTSTCFFGEVAKKYNGSVVAIDNFSGYSNKKLIEEAKIFNIKSIFERNIAAQELDKYVALVTGDAVDLSKNYAVSSFDIIFVDVGRSYYDMKKVLDVWYPKLAPYGLMCGYNADILVNNKFKEKFPDKNLEYFIKYFRGVDVAVGEKFETAKTSETGSIWFYEKGCV